MSLGSLGRLMELHRRLAAWRVQVFPQSILSLIEFSERYEKMGADLGLGLPLDEEDDLESSESRLLSSADRFLKNLQTWASAELPEDARERLVKLLGDDASEVFLARARDAWRLLTVLHELVVEAQRDLNAAHRVEPESE